MRLGDPGDDGRNWSATTREDSLAATSALSTHRTVALIGAMGSGKTTLAEALLFRAGAIARMGSVEQGTTALDHEPEEIARGATLGLAPAWFTWQGDGAEQELTLIDTPGHPDFVGAVDAALSVADVAVVVVSAVDGVTGGTRAAWAVSAAAGVPRIIVVTQEDRARADFRRTLAQLRTAFGDALWPLELPLGEEQDFHGVADLLSRAGARLRRVRPSPRWRRCRRASRWRSIACTRR